MDVPYEDGAVGEGSEQGPPRDRGSEPGPAPVSALSGPGPAPVSALSERELAVLAVERQGWTGPGAKERAVREQLGISPTRYYQLLNALLDDERAVAHDPVTVNRLRRVREERRGRR